MKENYSGIWSFHQYNLKNYDKIALKFSLKTKKYVFKTKCRTNDYAKCSWNEHAVFRELTTSNTGCLLVNFWSTFTEHNPLQMNILYIIYCWMDPFITLLRFYWSLQVINNLTIFDIAYTKIKSNAPVPFSPMSWTIESGWFVLNRAVSATSSGMFCRLSPNTLFYLFFWRE